MNQKITTQLRQLIRNVKDFPKKGIVFRDITPLLADGEGFAAAVGAMAEPFRDISIDLVVAIESRGFIFGAAVAQRLNCGFIPVRKPGKLPADTINEEYQLEYGSDKLEMHADAIKTGRRILIVDDLLATGGTMRACCRMVERLGGKIIGISFLIELAFLQGRAGLADYNIHTVIKYDQE